MRISDWSSDVCSSDLGEWLALSFADRVIAVSPSLAAQLRQSFPQRAHSIAYIHKGTSDMPGDADPALIFGRLGIADGEFLLDVARLVLEKGLQDLIEARQRGVEVMSVVAHVSTGVTRINNKKS